MMRDPAWIIQKFEPNCECLEVVARTDMKGKWLVRPVAREKRAALWKARQAASKLAHSARRKASESAGQSALSFMKSADGNAGYLGKDSEAKAARLRQATLRPSHRRSTASLASMPTTKGIRASISSIATSESSANSSTGEPSMEEKPSTFTRDDGRSIPDYSAGGFFTGTSRGVGTMLMEAGPCFTRWVHSPTTGTSMVWDMYFRNAMTLVRIRQDLHRHGLYQASPWLSSAQSYSAKLSPSPFMIPSSSISIPALFLCGKYGSELRFG